MSPRFSFMEPFSPKVSCCGATLGTVAGLGVACSSTCTAFAAAKGLGQGKSRDVDSKTVGF